MRFLKQLVLLFFFLFTAQAFAQQDVDFYITDHFFAGKKVLKISRDFYDPFVWVLAQNNEVYRINSVSKEIKDYTNEFSAYGNLQFTAIAGRNDNEVFVGTTINKVLYLKNGSIISIGSNEGLNYPVNSLGISFRYMVTNQLTDITQDALLIGTNYGAFSYNANQVQVESAFADGEIYDVNYRTLMNSGAPYQPYLNNDLISQKVYTLTEYYNIQSVVWFGKKDGVPMGNSLRAATYNNFLSFTNEEVGWSTRKWIFWGTDQGLYSLPLPMTYQYLFPEKHFLDGIAINKLTTIYGLTNFGDKSASYSSGLIKQDLLIGTKKGLYFSNSSFGDYFYGSDDFAVYHYDPIGEVNINDISVNHTGNRINMCENGAWVACDNGLYFLKADFAKYVNNQKLNAAQFEGDFLGPKEKTLCEGQTLTAEINPSMINSNEIQWFKNGVQIVGADKPKLKITQEGEYYCVLYNPCDNIHIETNSLTVKLNPAPAFTFNYTDKIEICEGSYKTLNVQGKASYEYRWYKNGNPLDETSDVLIVNEIGRYKAEVSACPGIWLPSKEVEVNVLSLAVPTISPDKSSYCFGDEAKLSLNVQTSSNYTINWYLGGVIQDSYKNKSSIKTNIPGNYSVKIENALTCSKSSSVQAIKFNPLPMVSISQLAKTTFCDGETIELRANFAGGSIIWDTGESTEKINVSKSGTYQAIITSSSECKADASVSVKFFPNPVLAISDTSLCQYNQEVIQLTAPPGFRKYIWNGVQGTTVLAVNKLGKVNLTVEDNNGCRASQEIMIKAFCSETKIPNTFTPNNDGINDTWNISGPSIDPSLLIQVYNRYGNLVFESKGYSQPWDGRKNGTILPEGTYYYILTSKSGSKKLSGYVTIIY